MNMIKVALDSRILQLGQESVRPLAFIDWIAAVKNCGQRFRLSCRECDDLSSRSDEFWKDPELASFFFFLPLLPPSPLTPFHPSQSLIYRFIGSEMPEESFRDRLEMPPWFIGIFLVQKISKNLQKIENFKESWRILKNIWKWVKIWINKGLKNLLEDWKRPAANSHRCVVRCHWIYSGFYYDNKNSCYDSCFVFILMMIIIIIKMNGRVDELILRFVSAGKTPE